MTLIPINSVDSNRRLARATSTHNFPPLELETRPTVVTAAAAHYLNRRPQTMRTWACLENGPLRPIRVNGRLAWPVAELRRILGVDVGGAA